MQPVLGVGKGGSDLALSGPAELAPHREHNQTALEHTPHAHNIRQRDGHAGSIQLRGCPSVWRAWCGVRRLSSRARGAAREPRRALGRFAPGAGPGVLTLGQSSCVVSGKSGPISQISEGPGPPRKAQVLLVPTAAAASFLYSPDRMRLRLRSLEDAQEKEPPWAAR